MKANYKCKVEIELDHLDGIPQSAITDSLIQFENALKDFIEDDCPDVTATISNVSWAITGGENE